MKGIFILNTLLTFLICFTFSNFDNYVSFSGDSVEYHSIAVNYLYGHDFMMQGGVEVFEKYKFKIKRNNPANWNKADFEEYQYFNNTRNPSYPFFLFTIYSIFGVNPYIVKIIQLLLFCISGSLLIPIAKLLFKNKGLILGLFASWIFIISSFKSSNDIYTEPLLSLLFALSTYAYLYSKIKKSSISFCLSILLFALCVLSKGIFYFFIIAIVLYEFFSFIKTKNIKQIKYLFVALFGIIALLTPYVIWQNINENNFNKDEFVFISSQGEYVLLTSNNEYCIDGDWHPEGYDDENDFYNTIETDLSSLEKVYLFYKNHPQNIIPTFFNKIKLAFWLSTISRTLLLISVALFCYYRLPAKFPKKLTLFILLILLSLSTTWLRREFYSFLDGNVFILISLSVLSFISLMFLINKFKISFLYPFILAPLMLTLVFYGYFRVIMPYYLMLSLLVVYLIYKFIKEFLYSKN